MTTPDRPRDAAAPHAPSQPVRPKVVRPADPAGDPDAAAVARLHDARERILAEIGKVIVGQRGVVDLLLTALFARGHCLLVGVPGLAKTRMVRALSSLLDLDGKRIQFTPDLMPSDVTGTEILEEDPVDRRRTFRFVKGPVFTNVLLADEINRTPPKTQSALLEAMQEYRVTASGKTYDLPRPFFVLATQNPIEQEGTYPLPEAQLDRFMFEVRIDYPSREDEIEIYRSTTNDEEAVLPKVLGAEEILEPPEDRAPHPRQRARRGLRGRPRAPRGRRTRRRPRSSASGSRGAGPRAGQNLLLAASARAALSAGSTPAPTTCAAALPVCATGSSCRSPPRARASPPTRSSSACSRP
jgi:MoxR-like ATPase